MLRDLMLQSTALRYSSEGKNWQPATSKRGGSHIQKRLQSVLIHLCLSGLLKSTGKIWDSCTKKVLRCNRRRRRIPWITHLSTVALTKKYRESNPKAAFFMTWLPHHSSNVFQETTELRQPSSPSQLAPSPHWLLPWVQQPTTHPARIGCCSTPNQLPMCWSFMENCHLPFCGWSLISHHFIQLSLLIVSDIINLQHHQLYVRSSHMQPCKSPAFCRSMVQPDGPYLVWGNPPFANDKQCHLVLTTKMTVWDWESTFLVLSPRQIEGTL